MRGGRRRREPERWSREDMGICLIVFILHLLRGVCCSSLVDKDSLCVHVIVSRGFNFPEYTQRTTVNDVTIFHHNSNLKSKMPRPDWITTTAGEEHWLTIQIWADHNKDIFTVGFESAIQNFNLTGSLSEQNIYQGMGCCHLYPNGTRQSSLTHSFNGRDFLSLDIERETYIAAVPQAVVFKHLRDSDTNIRDRDILASYYRMRCLERLKIMKAAPGVRLRKVPEVRILENKKAGPIKVTCHVTGFYPRAVQVVWLGPDLQLVDEGLSDVLPNEDGTYQTRRSVIAPEEDVGEHTYSCVVLHSSLTGNITRVWVVEKQGLFAVWASLLSIFCLMVAGTGVLCYWRSNNRVR